MQFGMNYMDLPKVRLAGVTGDTRTVHHGNTGMAIVLDAPARHQRDRGGRRLGEGVSGASADRDDASLGQGCLARALKVKPGGAAVSTWSGWYMSM